MCKSIAYRCGKNGLTTGAARLLLSIHKVGGLSTLSNALVCIHTLWRYTHSSMNTPYMCTEASAACGQLRQRDWKGTHVISLCLCCQSCWISFWKPLDWQLWGRGFLQPLTLGFAEPVILAWCFYSWVFECWVFECAKYKVRNLNLLHTHSILLEILTE